MKKFASALALAAAMGLPAAAQADANISGYVSMGVASYDYAGEAPDAADNSGIRVDDGRYSRIRFSGNEDLGNGLNADFMIEQRFTADTNESGGNKVAFNGNVWVGLSGGFGKISLGKIDTYYSDGVLTELSRATSFASFGTLSLLAQVGGAYAVLPSRHANQIRYNTPNLNGFKGTLAYSPNSMGDEGNSFTGGSDATDGDMIYLSGYYYKGPIYAGASYISQATDGANIFTGGAAGENKVTGLRAYGAYTFPFGLKVGLNVDKTKAETDPTNAVTAGWEEIERTAWFIPVTFKTGSHAIYGLYGQAGELDTDDGSVNDTGATMFNVGYDYGLSARTSVGVNFTRVDNQENGTYNTFLGGSIPAIGGNAGLVAPGLAMGGSPGTDVQQIYLGVAHAF